LFAGLSSVIMFRQGAAVASSSAVAATSMYILWALWRKFA
jgi:hypothetical protein